MYVASVHIAENCDHELIFNVYVSVVMVAAVQIQTADMPTLLCELGSSGIQFKIQDFNLLGQSSHKKM